MGCCFSKPASRQAMPPVIGAALASPSAQVAEPQDTGGVSGWVHDSNKQSEAELVHKVSANILGALTITRSLPPLVGVDDSMKNLLNGPALQQDQEVRMLGLAGMGGIGKTTLATALFNRLLPQFTTAHCFLADIRSHGSGLQHMQQQMLQELCDWKDAPLPKSTHDGMDLLRMRLGGRKACACLPLTLKVLGSFLRGKSPAIWTETLASLRRAEDLPVDDNHKVFQRLQISYDGLNWQQQQMFLDVACLLLGRGADTAKRIWAGSGWSPDTGLYLLTSRSLLTVDEDGNLAMHDQLRDMGRAIEARGQDMQQDLPITDRKRLWLSNEGHIKLLTKAGGALPNLTGLHATACQELPAKVFNGSSLRICILDDSRAPFTALPEQKELCYLSWQRCPLSELPSKLADFSRLAVLNLRNSDLASLPEKLPASLQEMDLA
ncbi:hypothetical protein WJX72_004818 [[Myrmecia] bisecta]|uniref:NB-ARC domain-containing protein n=1 Tax=[Myrmecia] bisecta TaxID=41462 RepID=A0AAW1PDJ3_9CHLO